MCNQKYRDAKIFVFYGFAWYKTYENLEICSKFNKMQFHDGVFGSNALIA